MGWVPSTEQGTLLPGSERRVTAAIDIRVSDGMPMSHESGRRPEGRKFKFYGLSQQIAPDVS